MSDRLAILIGNGRFENDPDLPALFGPRHDVSALGQILSDPEVGNFIVFEHLDRDSKHLVPELERLFAISNPDATVFLYYGGFVASKPGKGLFLSTADTEMVALDDTAIPLSFIKGLLRNCSARNKAVILDCCYGGPAGPVDEADIEQELRRIRSDVDPDLHVIASPASGQSAEHREFTTETGLEGRLTHTIVEGLATGAADRDGDNRTGVHDLNEYLGMRLGEERPLWTGPLDGADPEIVANPNPIAGVDVDVVDRTVDASTGAGWGRRLVTGVVAVAAVALVGWLAFGRGPGEPESVRLESFYSGPGLPERVGMVDDLHVLRAIIDRTGWIEHVEPLDGDNRYPSAMTLNLDPDVRSGPGAIDLSLRQWALLDFGEDVTAFGLDCAEGLNIADVVVEMVDGREYTFAVRTDRAGGEFIGFVAREPIQRVRVTATSTRFAAERLYLYARSEHPTRTDGR